MVTMNISMTDVMKEWVASKVASGMYSNYSDYMRDLIRRDQNNELLIKSLIEGENSGISDDNLDDIWKRVESRHE